MHKWYDGKTPDCDKCGWLTRETLSDGKDYDVCRWFSSVFHSNSHEKCEAFMSSASVKQYIERNQTKRKK